MQRERNYLADLKHRGRLNLDLLVMSLAAGALFHPIAPLAALAGGIYIIESDSGRADRAGDGIRQEALHAFSRKLLNGYRDHFRQHLAQYGLQKHTIERYEQKLFGDPPY